MDNRMRYELITPELAGEMLSNNTCNRPISQHTVDAYARDIINGKWTENTAQAIAFSVNGELLDGQHRLNAIIKSGISIHSWVCRDCDPKGIYDSNRRRTGRDQMRINKPELPPVFYNDRFLGMVKWLSVGYCDKVTSGDLIKYIEEHRETLEDFSNLGIFSSRKAKVSIQVVYVSLYMAFSLGVDGDKISRFYEVLREGMTSCPEEYPIIAYRNYLLDTRETVRPDDKEVKRCQGALYKYITGSCTKRLYDPKKVIWDVRGCI